LSLEIVSGRLFVAVSVAAVAVATSSD